MTSSIRFLLIAACVLVLGGCVSREQADAKLANACKAGVQSLLPEGSTIDRIASTDFAPSPEGHNMRHVKIKTVTLDGWLETEAEYECIFDESFGFMNANYTASIYQLRTGDAVYGKAGNEILGDAQDFIKLTDAIRKALYE